MQNKKIWFKAKTFGWGWYPVNLKGWLVTLLYVTAITVNFVNIDKFSHSVSDTLINFAVPFIVNTIFLLIICYAHGERPKWSWNIR